MSVDNGYTTIERQFNVQHLSKYIIKPLRSIPLTEYDQYHTSDDYLITSSYTIITRPFYLYSYMHIIIISGLVASIYLYSYSNISRFCCIYKIEKWDKRNIVEAVKCDWSTPKQHKKTTTSHGLLLHS